MEYSRFGLSREEIGDQSWSQAVKGTWSMGRPPGIRIKLLEFDVSSTKSCKIGKRCTALGRSQRWSLLEWGRLNPELLRVFFVRMVRDTGFQVQYANMYDGMRLMHMRILDKEAPRVQKVEDQLNDSVLKSFLVEKVAWKRSEEETLIRGQRVEKLESLSHDWTYEERTRWSEELPFIPNCKQRESRKRNRSISRSGADGNKKRRSKSRSDHGVASGVRGREARTGSSPQPEPGSPGVGSGSVVLCRGPYQDKEQEELGPGPSKEVSLRRALEPRRSLVRPAKKSSRSQVVLSYDELIEGPPRKENAYEDLDSVFEIPSDVEEFEI